MATTLLTLNGPNVSRSVLQKSFPRKTSSTSQVQRQLRRISRLCFSLSGAACRFRQLLLEQAEYASWGGAKAATHAQVCGEIAQRIRQDAKAEGDPVLWRTAVEIQRCAERIEVLAGSF